MVCEDQGRCALADVVGQAGLLLVAEGSTPFSAV